MKTGQTSLFLDNLKLHKTIRIRSINQTVIKYSLPYISPVRVTIYSISISGQIIHNESYSALSPGNYIFNWDGTGHQRKPVASGVYIAVISTKFESSAQRMMIVK